MKKENIGLVKLFSEIGNHIKEIDFIQNEAKANVDIRLTTKEGKRYLVSIEDVYCIECFKLDAEE